MTGVIAVLILGMVAIPTGILASGFTSALHRRREQVEDKIQDALTDGVLTTQEEAEIEALVAAQCQRYRGARDQGGGASRPGSHGSLSPLWQAAPRTCA